MSISDSGTCSVVMTAEKAAGKPVNSSTITMISQTWFASQTGPIACAISSRWASARGPRASRSQTPAP